MRVFGLSKNSLAKIRVKYSCPEEQEAIANILFQADNEINLLDKELEEWHINEESLNAGFANGDCEGVRRNL